MNEMSLLNPFAAFCAARPPELAAVGFQASGVVTCCCGLVVGSALAGQ